jgi:hypothetical protein
MAIAGGAVWLLVRRMPREEPPPAKAPRAAPPTTEPPTAAQNKPPPPRKRSYFGASLNPGPNACDAAQALSGKRYLANEAPKLPLPDCNAATCKCQIVPLSDRRSGHDRRDSFTPYGDYHPDVKHTWSGRTPGRRKDD